MAAADTGYPSGSSLYSLISRTSSADLGRFASEIPAENFRRIHSVMQEESRRRDLPMAAEPSKIAGLMQLLGGRTKVLEMRGQSEKILALVEQRCPKGRDMKQDPVFLGAGLEKLLADGHAVKPTFDELGALIAKRFTEVSGLSSEFLSAPVKGIMRARVKVSVSLNGDITQLRDVVRGTLKVTAALGQDTLQQVYLGIKDFAYECGTFLPDVQIMVARFKDRYQKPTQDGYSDWQFFLRLNGFICELQVNFEAALEEKENVQHKEYEISRMARDNLLHAAMKGDGTAVLLMLQTRASPQVTDSNNITPLHYAAAYGHQAMCSDLLKREADPLALDSKGILPVQCAMLRGHADVADLLLERMSRCELTDITRQLGQALVSAWGAAPASHADQMLRILTVTAEMSKTDRLFYSTWCNNARACQKILQDTENDFEFILIYEPFWSSNGCVLDHAIANGCGEVADLLLDAGGLPAKTVLHTDLEKASMTYAECGNALALDALHVMAVHQGVNLPSESLLNMAAKSKAFDSVMLLLRRGTKLTAPCEALQLELNRAASRGDTAMVRMMLNAEVDVNGVANDQSALQIASQSGQLKTCKLLVDHGADWRLFSPVSGFSALSEAVVTKRLALIEFYHSRGEDFKVATCRASGHDAYSCLNAELGDHRTDQVSGDVRVFTPIALAKFFQRTSVVNLIERLKASSAPVEEAGTS
eukprot:CAMPEP_0117493752 /NCGR_PEP_ID=MMETSP0784-20121206/19258_1 /TAXON_ID=39447 /ORGANISM="" /LENGTH=705 /DNA_ID=CAMNT_0005288611 /DNA_START=99 /DNA_END=2216 /DNA_ORIENTATION=-